MKKITPNMARFKELIRETSRILKNIQADAQTALANNGLIMEETSNERTNDIE